MINGNVSFEYQFRFRDVRGHSGIEWHQSSPTEWMGLAL